jgi:hypothetical protein
LVAAHGGDPGMLSTLNWHHGYQNTPTTLLMSECLHRACLAGSVPLVQVCLYFCYHYHYH